MNYNYKIFKAWDPFMFGLQKITAFELAEHREIMVVEAFIHGMLADWMDVE